MRPRMKPAVHQCIEHQELRRRGTAGGWVFLKQCIVCGKPGARFPDNRIQNPSLVPPFDEQLRISWKMRKKTFKNSRRRKYLTYIKSPKWARIRRQVLARDAYQCQVCGDLDAHEVDHLTYENFGQEKLSDLQTTCRECHRNLKPARLLAGNRYRLGRDQLPALTEIERDSENDGAEKS